MYDSNITVIIFTFFNISAIELISNNDVFLEEDHLNDGESNDAEKTVNYLPPLLQKFFDNDRFNQLSKD